MDTRRCAYRPVRNQEEKESAGQVDLGSNVQNQGNLESVLSNHEKDIEEDYAGSDSDMQKRTKKKAIQESHGSRTRFIPKKIFDFSIEMG